MEYRLAIVIDANGKPAVAALNEVSGAVTRTEAATERVVADTQASGRAAQVAARQYQDLARTAGVTAGALGQVDQRMQSTTRALGQSRDAGAGLVDMLRNVTRTAAALAGTTLGAAMVGQVTALVDGYTNMTSKLRLVTDSEAQLLQVRRELFDVSQDTRSVLGATNELYTRLDRSTAALGTSQAQVLRLTETINKSFVVSGASATEASAAIIQLSQGLASGALRGDEFNSVAEQAPVLMDLLAKSLGVTRGALRGMAEDGKLTADVLVSALLEGGADVDAMFAQMELTIGGASTQLSNAFQAWMGQGNEALGVSRLVAEGISLLAGHLGPLANLLGLVAVAWGTRYVAGVLAATQAAGAARVAAVELAAAELREAQAAEAAAVAQVNKARAMAAAGLAVARAAEMEVALAAAQARTAAATAASTAAIAANTGVLARMGSGLLALAGGPIGVGVIAIGGLALGLQAVAAAEVERQREFDAGIAQLRATTDQVVELSAALQALDGPPSPLAEQMRAAADATAQLVSAQAELAAKRRELALIEEALTAPGLSDSRFLNFTQDTMRLREEIGRLEPALRSLQDATGGLTADLASRFAPAMQAAAAAITQVIDAAASGDSSGAWSAFTGGLDQLLSSVSRINEADATAQRLFAEIQGRSKEAAAALQTAGKSAQQVAVELVDLAATRARDAGWSDKQIENLRAEGAAYIATVAAIDKAKTASRDAAAARREQELADRAAEKALLDHQRALIEQSAALGQVTEGLAEYQLALMDAEQRLKQQIAAGLDAAAAQREYANAVRIAQRSAQDAAVEGVLALTDELAAQDAALQDLASSYAEQIRLAQMSDEQRRAEEASLAAIRAHRQAHAGEIDAETEAGIRQTAAWGEAQLEYLRQSRRAAEEWQSIWRGAAEAVGEGIAEYMRRGGEDGSDILKDIMRDLANQITRYWANQVFTVNLQAQMQGGNAGGSGAGGWLSQIGSLFGGGQGAGGGGGGFNFGGFGNFFGGANAATTAQQTGNFGAFGPGGGNWNSSFGNQASAGTSGIGFMGYANVAVGAFNAQQSVRQGNVVGGMMGGAQAGMAFGPWGAVIGAIIGGLAAAIHGKPKPDFRLGGSEGDVRKPEGSFETAFGTVRAGSRLFKWEDLIAPLQNFDQTIHDIVASFGNSDEQLSAVQEALDQWEVDLRGSAATAENVLGSRFDAILATFDEDVRNFVGTTGELEERVQRLSDAAFIQFAAGTGELVDDFVTLAEILEDVRAEGEDIQTVYSRVAASTAMLEQAFDLMGAAVDENREQFIRAAVELTDAAGGVDRAQQLFAGYFNGFFSTIERAEQALSNARAAGSEQFDDIGLSMDSFLGEGGLAAFREEFQAQWSTLTAEQRVEWLEAANTLLGVTAAQDAYNQALAESGQTLGDATAELERLASIRSTLAGLSNELGLNQQNARQRAESDISARTQRYIEQLIELGASVADITTAESMRAEAIRNANAAIDAEINRFLGGLALDLNIGGLSELEMQQARINRQYDDYRDNLLEQGATVEQLAQLEALRTAALDQAAAATRNATQALEEYVMTSGQVANAANSGRRNALDVVNEATLSVRGDGLTDQQRQLRDLQLRFDKYIEQIEAGRVATLYNQFGGVQVQGNGAEIDAAIAQIEALRLEAIENLNQDWIDRVTDQVDARYEAELRWLEELTGWRDNLLLDERLTTLTPREQLDEAQRQYDAVLGQVRSTDPEVAEAARAQFNAVRNAYLTEAREYWGSNSDYQAIFDRLLADNQQLIDASPASSADATATADTIAAMASAAEVTNDELRTLTAQVSASRSDSDVQTRALIEELRKMVTRLDAIEGASKQTASNTAPSNLRDRRRTTA